MLSAESLKQIDFELAKYPKERNRSAIMGALRIAQVELGYLSVETIDYVAEYVGIPAAQALEVATFYNMYDLKPVGAQKITVCTNLPCALRGGMAAGEYLKEKLGIGYGETSADGKFTLVEGECMGACGDAPVLIVNNHKMCSFMTKDAIDAKLAEWGVK
ncbi:MULTISPECIES: NADH-quinone oxidoreductase subunit NuoE [Vitreoscilla]|uniref:NADH-quinone oxidoreductase subunit NuoE n=1 Tax=Vitreoscilla stercoraria TaxID=61 RepID=A0ABY4EGQ3_VITST|nr:MULTISPECIES: NADH-quinone oxidoreductase subunit NuoE [Vitreoscilla]AUZ06054.1 subunit E of NADH:ubiquinone oxidoreductase [Vitreoscilla sp. C1]UOO92577.1 NADH-quinone oxidoreductase subunit NuoE [Vitreoscilla stercoraria]